MIVNVLTVFKILHNVKSAFSTNTYSGNAELPFFVILNGFAKSWRMHTTLFLLLGAFSNIARLVRPIFLPIKKG